MNFSTAKTNLALASKFCGHLHAEFGLDRRGYIVDLNEYIE